MRMMRTILGAMVFAAIVLAARPALAHHSFAMFDMSKNATYTGVVVEYRWENPHSHIIVKVSPGPNIDPTTVGTWDIEGASINIMGRQGWTRATYKPGDPITVIAHPMKDGSKGASLFYAINPDGTRRYQDIARPKDDPSAQPSAH